MDKSVVQGAKGSSGKGEASNAPPAEEGPIISRPLLTRKKNAIVVVPASSPYIEALGGTDPLLKDFQLIHRDKK